MPHSALRRASLRTRGRDSRSGPFRSLRPAIFTLALVATLALTLPGSASAFGTMRIASGINRAIAATGIDYPGTGTIVYVVSQQGIISTVVNGAQNATPFLDIDALVYNPSGNDERGLLGFALHPDFVNNGEFFVHYSNNSGTTVISRFTLDGGDPLDADETSEEIILTQAQPFGNHNGGWIDFGPDGYFYISLGDGGSAGDPGNRAQNGNTLLGKILRIDVDGGTPYAIPADNPFVGAGDGFLDEIWAYGLRNAWRNSFDRQTGDLWIADVGQNAWEEINFEPAADEGGRNYGWRLMEGLVCYNPSEDCNDGSLTLPIHVYPHNSSGGFSVSGGYVHRDPAVPELNGLYIFADFVIPNIWTLSHDGNGGNVVVTNRSADFSPSMDGFTINNISSFGEGPNGELYLVSRGGATTGAVFQVFPDPADTGEVEFEPTNMQIDLSSQNPFSVASPLQFSVSLPEARDLTVEVIDAIGRQVRTLATGTHPAGLHAFTWNGRTQEGDFAPSGVYFLRAVTPNQIATQKVGFLR